MFYRGKERLTFDILTMTAQKSKSSSSSVYCATRYRSLEFSEYTYISHLKAFMFYVKQAEVF